ncbi:hypothetical protein IWQ57_000026 [Coemansia nantahalensis]|uniref:Uncharacterized protein n=2 Tax=Coemansia TaxID=4863 RepID=A0ACC1K8T5_9FUNG|nr:hypothetical protein IWQ57_000026 [Coemansia nantahalensis]
MLHAYLHHQLTPQSGLGTLRDFLQMTADTHRIRFTPAALALLDCAPVHQSIDFLQPRLQLADVPLARYTPKVGRTMLSDPSPTAANYRRWRADWVADAESTLWTAIHHMPLEAKHISLVWQLQHGCIPTAKQLQHMSPEKTDKCPSCRNLAPDRTTPLPAPEHREDLAHYFHCCARVHRFWLLVGRFLAHTLLRTHRHTSLAITPREVAHGFGAWSALLPNHAALHGLALWEIYRAHTEALFDTATVKTGDATFAR